VRDHAPSTTPRCARPDAPDFRLKSDRSNVDRCLVPSVELSVLPSGSSEQVGVATTERRRLPRSVPELPSAICLVEDVPPAELPAEIVRLALLAAGCRVALYVVDIGGSALRLLSGVGRWSSEIAIRQAIGPELPRGPMNDVQDDVEQLLPGAVAVPLWLRGRAVAVLVAEQAPDHSLEPLARQAAVAVELADRYTDVFATARRLRATTAAAEIQENLLPPRVLRTQGVQVAGGVVPAYEVGGDWYDYAANADGLWLAVADAAGKGSPAAGACTVALGAFRAARRAGEDLEQSARTVDRAVRELPDQGAFVTAVLAHFDPATAELRWLRCGHPLPLLCDDQGCLRVAGGGEGTLPLGLLDDQPLHASTLILAPDERFIVTSDGVWERRGANGMFGIEGIGAAVSSAADRSPAAIASALAHAVVEHDPDPPRDDATVLVVGFDTA
jgi:serine phosphatase RsbU (regulator of sigma subunit)